MKRALSTLASIVVIGALVGCTAPTNPWSEKARAYANTLEVGDPGKVADLQALGVRVRHGDYEDAESLRHAWEGAERLLLVSSNAAATGTRRAAPLRS